MLTTRDAMRAEEGFSQCPRAVLSAPLRILPAKVSDKTCSIQVAQIVTSLKMAESTMPRDVSKKKLAFLTLTIRVIRLQEMPDGTEKARVPTVIDRLRRITQARTIL